MSRFNFSIDTCTTGFKEHVLLDPLRPIPEQLNKRKLYNRLSPDDGEPHLLKAIIDRNMSLRIAFGWSFESASMLKTVVEHALDKVSAKFSERTGQIISDARGDWIGFTPHNIFEKVILDDLTTHGLIEFNNEIVDFQHSIVTAIADHPLFKHHSIIRDSEYRFEYFRRIRKDPIALADAFLYYIASQKETSLVPYIPRDIIEEHIGCHYLYHPDTWFQMLELAVLKDEVKE